MTSYNHFNYFAWVGYICIDQVGNLAIISRLLESESMPSNSARFRELVDRVIRSFFRSRSQNERILGRPSRIGRRESASSLARRAAACLVHYLGLRLLVDALALSSIVMKRCRESSISSSSRCGLSRVQNCGRLGGLHIFFQKKYSLPPSDRKFLQE